MEVDLWTIHPLLTVPDVVNRGRVKLHTFDDFEGDILGKYTISFSGALQMITSPRDHCFPQHLIHCNAKLNVFNIKKKDDS